MKGFLIGTLIFLLASFSALASGDHADREFVTGARFDLVKVNDVLVGTYDLIPIWAEKECGSHIRGFYKKGSEILHFSVEMKDRKLTGTFGDLTIQFLKIDKENKDIILKNGEREISVRYAFESFESPHFHDITFSFLNGHDLPSVVRLDGECCMGSMIFYSIFFYGIAAL